MVQYTHKMWEVYFDIFSSTTYKQYI